MKIIPLMMERWIWILLQILNLKLIKTV